MKPGRPKKYTTLEQLAQSKRDKAKRWYYKSKNKTTKKVVSIIPKQVNDDEIVAVPMDDDDDSPKATAYKVLSNNAAQRLKNRLLGTG